MGPGELRGPGEEEITQRHVKKTKVVMYIYRHRGSGSYHQPINNNIQQTGTTRTIAFSLSLSLSLSLSSVVISIHLFTFLQLFPSSLRLFLHSTCYPCSSIFTSLFDLLKKTDQTPSDDIHPNLGGRTFGSNSPYHSQTKCRKEKNNITYPFRLAFSINLEKIQTLGKRKGEDAKVQREGRKERNGRKVIVRGLKKHMHKQ